MRELAGKRVCGLVKCCHPEARRAEGSIVEILRAFGPQNDRNYGNDNPLTRSLAHSITIQAFTLIELTLVTAIILALIGLSIPLFKRTFVDLSAKNTAFNIAKLAGYAVEKSVIDRKNYKLIFDFNRRTYQLPESGRFARTFTLPKGLFFYDPDKKVSPKPGEEAKKQIVFYPDGHCGGGSIYIVDNSGIGYSVILKTSGGFAQIKEVTGEGNA